MATLRLFLSYQRYAALIALVAIAGSWFAISLVWSWWQGTVPRALATCGVLFIASVPLRFAWHIATKWPRKVRATTLATQRIAQGRFSAKSVERYCEDPCFRVVASEILRRSGCSRQERRRLIKEFTAQASEPAFVVYAPTSASETVRVDGALFPTNQT